MIGNIKQISEYLRETVYYKIYRTEYETELFIGYNTYITDQNIIQNLFRKKDIEKSANVISHFFIFTNIKDKSGTIKDFHTTYCIVHFLFPHRLIQPHSASFSAINCRNSSPGSGLEK